MSPRRRILVLGAGRYYVPVLRQLRAAGFTVLAVDRDPDAPGKAEVEEFAPIDFSDTPALLEWARERELDGVLPVNDFGTRSAARLAEALGLPGIRPAAAQAANDKGEMRDLWAAAGLAQPDYRVVHDLAGARAAARELGFPCVFKPTDCGGGGRGISVVRAEGDVEWSYAWAEPYLTNRRLVVEDYLEGIEMTVESVSLGPGDVRILAMSDKVKDLEARTRVATSLEFPSQRPPAVLAEVESLVQDAVAAIGVEIGMAHTEVIVTAAGPRLVELGARGGGGHVFHTLIEQACGLAAPAFTAALLCGGRPELPPPQRRGACYRFFQQTPGVVRAVRGVAEARALPGVLDLEVVVRPGDRVEALENSLKRVGWIATGGEDFAAAVAAADAAERRVEIELE